MPEKVTSLNGLKVTLEYCSYNVGAHNQDYVKYSENVKTQAGQGALRPCCKTLTCSLLLRPDYFNYKQHDKAFASALPAPRVRFCDSGHKKKPARWPGLVQCFHLFRQIIFLKCL